jgi:hypothetical protein
MVGAFGMVSERGLVVVAVTAAASEEARAAEDGPTLRGVERNRRLLPTLRALHSDFYALAYAGRLLRRDGSQPLVLRLLAGLATLRLVLQTLVVEEELLAARPDELLAAVYAEYGAILKLGLSHVPFSVGLRRRNLRCVNL